MGRLAGRHERNEGEARGRVERGEAAAAGVVAIVEHLSRRGAVGRHVLRHVRRPLVVDVVDDVRGVVGDDVEEDLHPARVRGVDQRAQVGVGPEVRVDLREVRDPVAVVAGRRPVLELDGLVLEARRQPDRRRAEALDVVDPVEQALEVAAVVEAGRGGVEAVLEPAARDLPGVVGREAVLEAVGHDEVEVLARDGRPQAVTGVAAGPGRSGQDGGEQDCENGDGARTGHGPLPLGYMRDPT